MPISWQIQSSKLSAREMQVIVEESSEPLNNAGHVPLQCPQVWIPKANQQHPTAFKGSRTIIGVEPAEGFFAKVWLDFFLQRCGSRLFGLRTLQTL